MTEFAVAMGILLGTILIGIPISYSMGITGLVYILITNPDYIVVIPNRLYEGVNQFQLLAIPFFGYYGQCGHFRETVPVR